MNFNSYIVKNVEIAQTVPLSCPPPQKLASNKGFRLFRRHTKRAFTLAETLITLTIIGVIAAVTIPTLVSKYQKHSYVTGLKKAYSSLSNTMALAMHDDEVLEYDSSWSGGINWSRSQENIINKYMKVVKTCEYPNLGDCVEVRDSGYSIQSYNTTIYVTADGMTWGTTHGFAVDINGKKGPNQWGRDIFWFEIADYDQNGVAQGTVMPVGSKLYAKYWGDSNYWNYNPSSPRCTTESVNQHGKSIGKHDATYCTGRVLDKITVREARKILTSRS